MLCCLNKNLMPLIPVFWRQRQEEDLCGFHASLVYRVPGQSGLHRETLVLKTNQPKNHSLKTVRELSFYLDEFCLLIKSPYFLSGKNKHLPEATWKEFVTVDKGHVAGFSLSKQLFAKSKILHQPKNIFADACVFYCYLPSVCVLLSTYQAICCCKLASLNSL